MDLVTFISDFKTDVNLKEQQLEELLSHNKEMVEIAEVLEQAAAQKKDDIANYKMKLTASNKEIDSTITQLTSVTKKQALSSRNRFFNT